MKKRPQLPPLEEILVQARRIIAEWESEDRLHFPWDSDAEYILARALVELCEQNADKGQP